MKAYFAGPLGFDEPGKVYMRDFLIRLEDKLPFLSIINPWELTTDGEINDKGIEKMIPVIYERDVNGIIESDFVIAVLNGVQVDDGTAFEIGYAKALGKKIVAYRDDFRTPCKESPFVDFNIMIDQSIIKPVAHSLDELVCIIKDNFKV